MVASSAKQLKMIMFLVYHAITYDRNRRQHIGTFAAGIGETPYSIDNCPCIQHPGRAPPSFVGNHYYCESGNIYRRRVVSGHYYLNDTLWDGAGCMKGNHCCDNPIQPWFIVS